MILSLHLKLWQITNWPELLRHYVISTKPVGIITFSLEGIFNKSLMEVIFYTKAITDGFRITYVTGCVRIFTRRLKGLKEIKIIYCVIPLLVVCFVFCFFSFVYLIILVLFVSRNITVCGNSFMNKIHW